MVQSWYYDVVYCNYDKCTMDDCLEGDLAHIHTTYLYTSLRRHDNVYYIPQAIIVSLPGKAGC